MKNARYPEIKMKPGHSRRVKAGSPWAFSNEIEMTSEAKSLPNGTLVCLTDSDSTFLGLGTFNARSLISFRKIANDPQTVIDKAFIAKRLRASVALRDVLVNSPFYRLIHSEADGLPGLVIDRFDDIIACQINTAGMDNLKNEIVAAVDEVLSPSCIVLRSENASRALEGLDPLYEVAKGELPDAVPVRENGIYFYADLKGGQKTGWFYDQRDNRAFVGRLARNKRVIDFYTYAGGFALHMGIGGAKEIIGVDRSEASLELAKKAAEKNGLSEKCTWLKDNAFDVLRFCQSKKRRRGRTARVQENVALGVGTGRTGRNPCAGLLFPSRFPRRIYARMLPRNDGSGSHGARFAASRRGCRSSRPSAPARNGILKNAGSSTGLTCKSFLFKRTDCRVRIKRSVFCPLFCPVIKTAAKKGSKS